MTVIFTLEGWLEPVGGMMDLLSGLGLGPDKALFLSVAHQLYPAKVLCNRCFECSGCGVLRCGGTTLSDKSPKNLIFIKLKLSSENQTASRSVFLMIH